MSQSVEQIFDSALSHTRRSDAVEIRVDTLAQIRLCTSFESSPVSVKLFEIHLQDACIDENGEVTSAGCTDPEHLNGVFCARHPQIEALISEGCPTITTTIDVTTTDITTTDATTTDDTTTDVTTTPFPIPTTKPPTEGFCIANRSVYFYIIKLTDTSEDSKFVDRRICAKVATRISTASERRV